MLILLDGDCFLTYYFHAIVETGMVFTHFFYIPVILAALWWRRKGLVVAIFLAALLIFSHNFVRADMVTANDYLRAFMFIVIAFVVAALSEMIAKAHEKTAHLNAILSAIRNVNQLIVREKDRDRLIQRTCENLIETRGYYSAWIAIVDENGGFLTAVEAGLGESFVPVVEMMKRGEFTRCGQKALKQSKIVVVEDVTAADCADCPLVGTYSGRVGMAIRLEYRDRIYGILSVSIPAEMAADADEQSLFNEVAGDIALALRDMEQEGELRKHRDHLEELVEERTQALRDSEEKYGVLFETAKDAIFLSDETGKFVDVNQVACESLGYSKEELLKLGNKDIDADPRGYEAFLKVRNGLLKEVTFEVNQRRKDGSLLPVEITGSLFTSGSQRLALAIARDITERKQAEEALRESEEKYRLLAENTLDCIWKTDKDLKFTYVNPSTYTIVGFAPEEWIGSTLAEHCSKEETERIVGMIAEGMKKESYTTVLEMSLIHKDGREIPAEIRGKILIDENKELIGLQGTTTDITDRMGAEGALHEAYSELQEAKAGFDKKV